MLISDRLPLFNVIAFNGTSLLCVYNLKRVVSYKSNNIHISSCGRVELGDVKSLV